MIFKCKWFQPSFIPNFKLVCNLQPEFHVDQQHVVTSLQNFVLATGIEVFIWEKDYPAY